LTGSFAAGVVFSMTIVAPRSQAEIVKKPDLIPDVAEVVEDGSHVAIGHAHSPEDPVRSAQMRTVGA
jgi:hypothetical protein